MKRDFLPIIQLSLLQAGLLMTFQTDYEFLVIGSGFGGGVMSARLSKRWPGKGLLLERGKAYPLGSFPRSPADLANNFWAPADEPARAGHVKRQQTKQGALTGMFDVRTFHRMDTVTCAGLGGGSLIYANVFLRPPEHVFAAGWPQGLNRQTLAPYYDVGQSILGAKPVPPAAPGDRRYLLRKQQFASFAKEQGLQSHDADIAVYFGRGYSYDGQAAPTEIGVQEPNRFGARQTSCTYCGECDIGCNVHAKNTTDLNYIHVARTAHGLAVRTLCRVNRIVPLNAAGLDDPGCHGEHGYRVHFDDLGEGRAESVTTQRVVVSAGTLGSNELLLKNRDHHRTLPDISPALGQRFSGNGDFLSFALDGEREINSTYGPVITQYTDHHLFQNPDPEHAFLLEDASVPTHAGWAMAVMEPMIEPWERIKRFFGAIWDGITGRYPGHASGRLGFFASKLMAHDITDYSAVLLCMGRDAGDGRFSVDAKGQLMLD
jgi:cholesterol oxidase